MDTTEIKKLQYENMISIRSIRMNNINKTNEEIINMLNNMNLYYYGQKCKVLTRDFYTRKFNPNFEIFTSARLSMEHYSALYTDFVTLTDKEFNDMMDNDRCCLHYISLSHNQIDFMFNKAIAYVPDILKFYDISEDYLIEQIKNSNNKNLLFYILESKKPLSCNFLDKYFHLLPYNKIYIICKNQNLEEWFIKKYIDRFTSRNLNFIIKRTEKYNSLLSESFLNQLKLSIKLKK